MRVWPSTANMGCRGLIQLFPPNHALIRNVMKSLLSITGENKTEYNVSFLPPLVVNFEIPADYPSTSPPLFTLSCKWMTRAQVRTHNNSDNPLLCHKKYWTCWDIQIVSQQYIVNIKTFLNVTLDELSMPTTGWAVGGESGLCDSFHMDPVPQRRGSGLSGYPVASWNHKGRK